jgi:ATP-dependent Zn protease
MSTDKHERQETLWRLQEECKSHLQKHWKEVQALANALLARRRMTGQDIRQVLEGCGTEIALTFSQGTAQKFEGRKK